MRKFDLGLLVMLGGILTTVVMAWQAEKDARRRAEEILCQQTLRMEHLFIDEHPEYSRAIYYPGAKTCGGIE